MSREPYKRQTPDADAMNLPAGRTCSHCRFFPNCKSLISRHELDEVCDWSPSGFKLDDSRLYLLQNVGAGYLGNSPLFWSTKGGYTQWIDDAKQWTEEEADKQIRSTRGTHEWAKWSLAEVNGMSKRTIDIQDQVRQPSEAPL